LYRPAMHPSMTTSSSGSLTRAASDRRGRYECRRSSAGSLASASCASGALAERGQELALSGHALAETYSVLTRLPGDARLSAEDAARLLDARFATPLMLSDPHARTVYVTLSRLGIAGGYSL
jgi:hypothetical protein